MLRRKSDAYSAFLRFNVFAEKLTGRQIGAIRDDKGGEFMPKELDELCIAEGIQRQHTVRNEPHQNGVAERANRTLAEGATSLLMEANLPPSFWGLSVAAFVQVKVESCRSMMGLT